MSCASGPTSIVTNGLVLDLDAANIKSINPTEVDVYAWGGGGAGGTIGGWSYGAAGGAGGASYGKLKLVSGTTYNIIVGGGGGVNSTTSAAGGGGIASRNGSDNRYGSGGGGYSGIFNGAVSQATALLIAGGGGGGGSSRAGTGNVGGAGGGTIAQDGTSAYDAKTAYAGKAGTQTAAGADASCDSANASGFQGALQGGTCRINCYGGAGGGGYWGGSAGGYSESNTMGGGGGGSGFYNPSFITIPTLTTGSYTIPGNAGDWYRGAAGNAGGVANAGSNGAVVIRYPGPQKGTGGTISFDGSYTTHTFTGAGTFTQNVYWATVGGANYNGTLNNGPIYNSSYPNNITFDGANDFTSFSGLGSSTELTVQMFVNVASNSGTYRGFCGANDGSGNDYTIGFNVDMLAAATTAVNVISIEGAGITNGNHMNTSIPFGQWFNLCVVISASASTLYINGTQQQSKTRTSAASMAMTLLTVGARPVTGNQAASYASASTVANFMFYKRAITTSEMLQNFNALRSRFGI